MLQAYQASRLRAKERAPFRNKNQAFAKLSMLNERVVLALTWF
jgi:hypothetical protein